VNALAIIELPFTENKTVVEVMIRNKKINAVVTKIPFLQPFNKR